MNRDRPPEPRELSAGRVVVGFAVLALVTMGLLLTGSPRPRMPAPWSPELLDWLDQARPETLAAGLLRLAGLGLCGYLGLALAVFVVVHRGPSHRPARRLPHLAPAFLWRALSRSARSGIATGVVLGWVGSMTTGSQPAHAETAPSTAPPSPVPGDPSHTATMTGLEPGGGGTTAASPPAAGATMVELGGPPGEAPGAPPGTPDDVPPTPRSSVDLTTPAPDDALQPAPAPSVDLPTPVPGAGMTSAPPSGTDEWVVVPGESFWSIAEEALTEVRGGVIPGESDVARYWQQLIAANRERLVAPDNPDLLLAGQVLVIPAPEGP